MKPFDVQAIRQDFPILNQRIGSHELVYFDNAATTQKPRLVTDALAHYYSHDNANVHRGVHALSVRATDAYEGARRKIQAFIHAPSVRECIFVRGTTEAINLVAQSFVAPRLNPGDEIVLTQMEHHANIVPWQMLCQRNAARLVVAPINERGEIIIDEFAKCLTDKTKFVALNFVSNALGTINPVVELIALAKAKGIPVLLDGAQATAHLPVNVQELACDFYAFSAHKMYGPTGVGVLWGKEELLNAMPPYQGGGEMIQYVSFSGTEYADLPYKFEAGTPNIADAIAFGAALDYLTSLDARAIAAYEAELLAYATQAVAGLPGFRIIGTAAHKVPIISLVHERIHAHDIGTILDTEGIAIRSGHHCAMPLMDFFGVAATSRLSLAFYNTFAEIDRCIQALAQVNKVFA